MENAEDNSGDFQGTLINVLQSSLEAKTSDSDDADAVYRVSKKRQDKCEENHGDFEECGDKCCSAFDSMKQNIEDLKTITAASRSDSGDSLLAMQGSDTSFLENYLMGRVENNLSRDLIRKSERNARFANVFGKSDFSDYFTCSYLDAETSVLNIQQLMEEQVDKYKHQLMEENKQNFRGSTEYKEVESDGDEPPPEAQNLDSLNALLLYHRKESSPLRSNQRLSPNENESDSEIDSYESDRTSLNEFLPDVIQSEFLLNERNCKNTIDEMRNERHSVPLKPFASSIISTAVSQNMSEIEYIIQNDIELSDLTPTSKMKGNSDENESEESNLDQGQLEFVDAESNDSILQPLQHNNDSTQVIDRILPDIHITSEIPRSCEHYTIESGVNERDEEGDQFATNENIGEDENELFNSKASCMRIACNLHEDFMDAIRKMHDDFTIPDIQSVNSPEVQCDISPEVHSDMSREIQSDISREILSDISPEIQCNISPEIESDISHKIESDISHKIQSDIFPEIQSGISHDIQCDIFPEIQCDIFPEIQCGISPQIQCDNSPGIKCDIRSAIQSDIFGDIQSDNFLEIESDISNEIESDIFRDIQSDNFLEIESDISNEIESDISNEIESDISNEIQSDISNEIQSGISNEIQSDISPRIQCDMSSEIQSDICEIQADIAPVIQYDMSSEIQFDICEIQADVAPGIQSDISPGIQSDISPEIQSDICEIQRDIAPVIQYDMSSEIQRDIAPVIQYDMSSEIQRDIAPVIQYDMSSEIQFDICEIQADIAPGIQSDISPGIQSDISPEIQSDICEIQADIFPRIQCDMSSEIQSDICEIQADIAPEIQSDISSEVESDISSEVESDISRKIQSELSPEIQSDSLPGIQSDLSPEIQSDISPEIISYNSPEILCDISPKVQSDISREIQSELSREIQFELSREIQSDILPEIQSESLPEIQSESLPEIQSESLPEIQSDNLPEIQSDNFPEIQSDNLPEIQSDNLPEIQSDNLPEIQSDNFPEIQSDNLPEIQSDNLPEIQSDNLPEILSDNLPEIQSDNLPEIQSYSLQDIQSHISPEIQSDISLEIQSEISSEIQSDVSSEIQSDICPEIQSDISHEIQCDYVNNHNVQLLINEECWNDETKDEVTPWTMSQCSNEEHLGGSNLQFPSFACECFDVDINDSLLQHPNATEVDFSLIPDIQICTSEIGPNSQSDHNICIDDRDADHFSVEKHTHTNEAEFDEVTSSLIIPEPDNSSKNKFSESNLSNVELSGQQNKNDTPVVDFVLPNIQRNFISGSTGDSEINEIEISVVEKVTDNENIQSQIRKRKHRNENASSTTTVNSMVEITKKVKMIDTDCNENRSAMGDSVVKQNWELYVRNDCSESETNNTKEYKETNIAWEMETMEKIEVDPTEPETISAEVQPDNFVMGICTRLKTFFTSIPNLFRRRRYRRVDASSEKQ